MALTDIDALALAVRDQESRRLIAEAITAYRGGALRSAIMSTWIAVAFDIIAKARELAAQGEAAPKAFVQDLDSAMANRDIKKMQTIESDLLKIANDQLQLFAPHELDALERLAERPQPVCPSGIYLGWRAVPADPGAGAVSHCSRAPALAGPCSFTGEKRDRTSSMQTWSAHRSRPIVMISARTSGPSTLTGLRMCWSPT